MTRKQANTAIGTLGCIVVALIIAVISILSFNTATQPLRVGGYESAQTLKVQPSQQFKAYSIASALSLNNSPFSPEAAF